ncbi:MAG: D-alanine--D-alanine ligase [Candidatus Pacebacteria bacterium]|nr:D-alanine--D-alanine ligase [Candidatus Paceibacterota bacterium]
MSKTRIGVVRGGPSDEYEVSLKTGAAALDALDREKYEAVDIVISKSGAWHIQGVEVSPTDALRRVDVVLNALHGRYGEDGKIQQLFEAEGIPFTGSDSLSSAMAMAKHLAKGAFERAGLKAPLHVLVESKDGEGIDATEAYLLAHSKFALPYVVKPAVGGSSLGVGIVKSREQLVDALNKAFENGDSVLIEECIPGVEATVGVIEGFRNKGMYTLPPVEIRKQSTGVFGYEAKYKSGSSEEIVPATFSASIKSELERLAVVAHEALGLSHYSRSDFIVSPHRGIYILETNSLPGLTEESLVPKALKAVGSSLPELVSHLITLALNE